MWEVYALALVSEMRTRAALARLNEMELDVLYARAKTRLWEKIERLRTVPEVSISEFGTRRRHSFLWQEYVIQSLRATLGPSLAGSSNTFLAYKHDLEAMGTNAHELPMAMAALADDDAALHASQYRVLELWQQSYGGELLILLPDTFGTTQFLQGAPDWVADWTGQRVDSKDPSSPETSTSAGSKRAAATRAASASSRRMDWMSKRFSSCTIISTAASASPPDGEPCSPTTFAAAIPAASATSNPSAWSAN